MIQFRIKYPYEYKLAKRSEITYYCDKVLSRAGHFSFSSEKLSLFHF